MLRSLFIIFLFLLLGGVFAQKTDYHRYATYGEDGKLIWGCIERVANDTIIKANFRKLDKIKPHGARYSIGEHWGLLDSTCKVVFPAGEYHYVNEYMLEGEYYWVTLNKAFNYGLYDSHHTEVLPERYKTIQPLNHILIEVKKDSLAGVMNKNLEWLIEPKFHSIRKFKNGYARTTYNYLSGFINEQGKEVIKPQYRVQGEINSNRLCVYGEKKKGYLNTKDELVIPFKFIQASQFYNGYATAFNFREIDSFPLHGSNLKGKMGLIDTNGSWVIEPKYEFLGRMHHNYYLSFKNKIVQDTFYLEDLKPLPDYHFAQRVYEGLGKHKNLVLLMHQEGKRYGMKKTFIFKRNLVWEFNKQYWITNLNNDTLTKRPHEYMAYNQDYIFLKHFRKWKAFDEEKGKVRPVKKLNQPFFIVNSRSHDDAIMGKGVMGPEGTFIVGPSFQQLEYIDGVFYCSNRRDEFQFDNQGKLLKKKIYEGK